MVLYYVHWITCADIVALMMMTSTSFHRAWALQDFIFAQVKEEIWSRIRRIQALGSALLGQRLTDLAFDLEIAFDVLAKYRVNLTHDAHELFKRQWADQ